MTDEEKLAEEYAKANAKKGLSYREVTRTYDEITGYPYFLEDKIKKAYLAGLKAGRPKWHNLQKDPNDLPKVNQKVLLQIKDEGRPIIDFYTRYGVWNFTNEYEAIAWCEIPKFEEK